MIRTPARLLALAVFALALMAPSIAMAAIRTDVWQGGTIRITDLDPQKEATYVVTLALKTDIKTPTAFEVGVPIPDGAGLLWAGAIGADPNKDYQAMDAHIETINGQRVVAFKMNEYLVANVELSAPKSMVTDKPGSRQIDLTWSPIDDIGKTQFIIVAPQGAKAIAKESELETVAPITDGTAYVKEFSKISGGKTGTFKAKLVSGQPDIPGSEPATPTAEPTAAATPTQVVQPQPLPPVKQPVDPMRIIMLALIGLLAVAITATVLIYSRQKAAPAEGEDEDTETDEGSDE